MGFFKKKKESNDDSFDIPPPPPLDSSDSMPLPPMPDMDESFPPMPEEKHRLPPMEHKENMDIPPMKHQEHRFPPLQHPIEHHDFPKEHFPKPIHHEASKEHLFPPMHKEPIFPKIPSFPKEPVFPRRKPIMKEPSHFDTVLDTKHGVDHDKTIFIEVGKYRKVLKELNSIKKSLKQSDTELSQLIGDINDEEQTFATLHNSVSEVESKLTELEESLFSQH